MLCLVRAAYAGILSVTRHCPVVTSEPGCFHSSWSDQSILVIHQCPVVDKSGCSHSSWSDQSVLVVHQCLMVDKSGCSHSSWSDQSILVIHQCQMVDKSGCSHSSWSDQSILVIHQCPVVDKSGCSHSSWSDQSILVIHQCPVVEKSGCSHSSWSDQWVLVIHQCLMVDKSGCSHSSWSDQWVLVMQQCLMVDKSGCSHSDWSNQSLSYTGAWWSTAALGVSISFTSFTFAVWMKARSACKDVGAGVEYMQVRFELNYLFVWGNFYIVLRVLLQKQTMWMACLKGSFWRLGGKTWWACHKKRNYISGAVYSFSSCCLWFCWAWGWCFTVCETLDLLVSHVNEIRNYVSVFCACLSEC